MLKLKSLVTNIPVNFTLSAFPPLDKENIPLRRILASQHSFNYQAAVWLNDVIVMSFAIC